MGQWVVKTENQDESLDHMIVGINGITQDEVIEDRQRVENSKRVLHFVVFDQSKSMDRSLIYGTKKEFVLDLVDYYTDFCLNDKNYYHEYIYFSFSENINKRAYSDLRKLEFIGNKSYIVQNIGTAARNLAQNFVAEKKYLIIITDGKDNCNETETTINLLLKQLRPKHLPEITTRIWIGLNNELTRFGTLSGGVSCILTGDNIEEYKKQLDTFLRENIFSHGQFSLATPRFKEIKKLD